MFECVYYSMFKMFKLHMWVSLNYICRYLNIIDWSRVDKRVERSNKAITFHSTIKKYVDKFMFQLNLFMTKDMQNTVSTWTFIHQCMHTIMNGLHAKTM